ncbi:GIY-YIG nuclease family protein [Azospirillum sp. YIM DDC1]|uniref:GIY-YIG nuclease family protein n=1 Tax=Azospirillum aestuarii TaxID=2802052 RepID=A0ABS1HRY4_9PROT|nr:GIY-YIG nuclease family protein [Azospirillum aestuarii]
MIEQPAAPNAGIRARLFLTKTWGFDPARYPTLGFKEEGGRENLLRQARHGDWIAIAGTKGEPTATADQGRLLGMCQLGHEKVDADRVMRDLGVPMTAKELDAGGQYRWRWALPMTRAVAFVGKPDLQSIVGSYLPGQVWAAFARDVEVELGDEVANRIWALPSTPCVIASTPQLDREAAYAQAMELKRTYGASGPPPTGTRSGSERQLGLGYAYAFVLTGGRIAAYKIGSTSNPADRLAALNRELRPHLTGCAWEPMFQQIFPSETFAYRFEQLVLRRLRDRLVPGDREVVAVTFGELERTWTDIFVGKEWGERTEQVSGNAESQQAVELVDGGERAQGPIVRD